MVQVEDEGEYVCRAYNDRAGIENSVILNIQGTNGLIVFQTFVTFCSLFS